MINYRVVLFYDMKVLANSHWLICLKAWRCACRSRRNRYTQLLFMHEKLFKQSSNFIPFFFFGI